MAETYDKFTRGSNPVKYFIGKGLEVSQGFKEPKIELFDHYEKFCKEFGLSPESEQSFSRKLRNEGFNVKRFRVYGELVYCWVDIKAKDWSKEDEQEQQQLADSSQDRLG
jgi:hypothetical protein